MDEQSKDYLLKTVVAIVSLFGGACAYHYGQGALSMFGGLCFIIGFLIMLWIYGFEWINWWR